MQNFLAWKTNEKSGDRLDVYKNTASGNMNKLLSGRGLDVKTSFAYQDAVDQEEEGKLSGIEAVYTVIGEQPETDYEDMIASNLVQFEYDVY